MLQFSIMQAHDSVMGHGSGLVLRYELLYGNDFLLFSLFFFFFGFIFMFDLMIKNGL